MVREVQGGPVPHDDYAIDRLISAKSIAARIEALAHEIVAEFAGTEKLVVVRLPPS
jgi:hypoxanthine phosphoribosyltransferase